MIVIFTNLYILYIGMISGYQMSINKELDFAFVFVRRKPLLIAGKDLMVSLSIAKN